MKRIRIVLVPVLVVLGFGTLAPSCGGGGCGAPPEKPAQPTTPSSP